jgi:antitoxin component YwqK of YwqJK toxin-antitoxin module
MSSEPETCYICYEEASTEKPFLNKQMCACTSKADSSLKIHQLCLELSRDSTNTCNVCKTALSSQWAFDDSFKVSKIRNYVVVSQGEPEAPHGVCYKLRETHVSVGPIRSLAETCHYMFGEKHGVEIENFPDCSIEYNWSQGQLHGRCIKQDLNGKVLFECNHVEDKKHGRCVHYNPEFGPSLVENYVDGALHGTQQFFVLDPKDNWMVLQKQMNYENGVLHGPVQEWTVSEKPGQSGWLYKAEYKNGFRHGRFVSKQVIHRDCTVTEEFWSDGTQELRHGLHRIESNGKVFLNAQYIMGKLHGMYFERDTVCGQLRKVLNYNNGKLHGECRLFGYKIALCRNMMTAYGKFVDGVPVGQHVLFDVGWDSKMEQPVSCIQEIINYDAQGQLHGTCIFNNSDCTKNQVLNFKHGVLHGRQLAYAFINRWAKVAFQLPEVAFHMKDGVLHGYVETTDARGEIHRRYVQPDDDVSVRDILGERALRLPSVRSVYGFESQYVSATGDVYGCESKALGLDTGCTCDECYTHEDMENDYEDEMYETDSECNEDYNDWRERRQEEREWRTWDHRQRHW